MSKEQYISVSSDANHFPCDFCDKVPVGYTQIDFPNRSLGGVRKREVFMVCHEHLLMGTPVFPDRSWVG